MAQANPGDVEQYSQRQDGNASNAGVPRQPEFIFITPEIIPEQKKPDPGPYKPNCDEPQSAEDGNFCQARRAAKAAEDAARAGEDAAVTARDQLRLGWLGFFGLVLTVVFAAWAAFAASRAARYAAISAKISAETLNEFRRNAEVQAVAMNESLRIAHESMVASYKAVYAAEDGVRVAGGANRIMADSSERQLRAYVCVTGLIKSNRPEGGDGFGVAVEIKNTGITPAYDVVTWAIADISEYPLSNPFPIYCLKNFTSGVLARDAVSLHIPVFTRNLTPLEEQAIISDGKAIYVYGEAHYRDVFGNQRLTRFRFRCHGQGYTIGTFKADGEGNEST